MTNILIPMAGFGQRFVDAGYTEPKPFIDVCGKPMIQRVVENLGADNNFIFVVQAKDAAKHDVIRRLHQLCDCDCEIIVTTEPTAGAACTALLAYDYIANNDPLMIANSDQLVEFGEHPDPAGLDNGVIHTFLASHPKWSYAAVDPNGRVWGVAEKQVISNQATCGVYWFQRGNDFVRAARAMIEKNLRVNNEFYIAPVFNQLIAWRADIRAYPVHKMIGLGTPEDLKAYVQAHRGQAGESTTLDA